MDTQAPAFRSTGTSSRLLWRQSVHEAFSERCHYYILSGRDAQGSKDTTFSGSLAKLLRKVDITSFSINAVYGPYDAILRVWMTTEARLRFIRELDASSLQIDDTLEFIADSVFYENSEDLPLLSKPTEEREHIERVVKAANSGDFDDAAMAAFSRLEAENYFVAISPSRGVKVYMFFEDSPRAHTPRSIVHQEIVSTIHQTDASDLSVYTGIGFCTFLVKFVVPTYDDVLGTVNMLRRNGKAIGLRPWTLLAADYAIAEAGESIDAVLENLPTGLETLRSQMGDPDNAVKREMSSLADDDKRALDKLFSKARQDLAGGRALERYIEILRFSLFGDRGGVNRSLSFLSSIEGDLRESLPRILASERMFGLDWFSRLRALCQIDAERDKFSSGSEDWPATAVPIADWTLSPLLMSMAVAANHAPAFDELVGTYLGPNWRSLLNTVLGLRNDYMHSRLVSPEGLRDFSGDWGVRLIEVADAITFQIGLERMTIDSRL